MKKILQSIVAAVGLAVVAVSPAMAQGFSVNVTGTTNYMWRGITQSANDPALQGGVDYDFGNGLAVGTWASTVDFGDGETSLEWDLYGSYTTSFTETFGATFGVIGYLYPDGPDGGNYDFVEFYAGPNLTLGIASVTARVYYSPEFFGNTGQSLYWTGGISIPFAGFLTASANVGYSDLDLGLDYTDYNIGLAATYEFLTLTGMFVGNDLPGSDEEFVGMLTAKFSVP